MASVFDDEQEIFEYQPKTKEELKEIINKIIDEKGNECDLNDRIDISQINDLSFLFFNSEFNGDISRWDVSKVKDMSYMFYMSKFNGDISKWDVSSVKNMECMFYRSSFNRNISTWKIKKDCNTYHMFDNCPINPEFKPQYSLK